MRLGLILSNDWELFGDGSGDFNELQVRRLQQLLDAAEAWGAKLTVMAEIGQQWAHTAWGATETWARDIADAWESSLIDAIGRGHDVQVHLHPQWLGAEHRDGRWRLDLSKIALPSLSAHELRRVLQRCRNDLEALLQPIRPNYRAVLFRAGLFCIEPAAQPLAALLETGYQADTSVTKGLFDPRRYDFRQTPHAVAPWQTSTQSVTESGTGGLVELPIAACRLWDFPIARKVLGWHYTRWLTRADRAWRSRRAAWLAERYPAESRAAVFQSAPQGRARLARLQQAIIREQWVPLDYDELPATVFVDLVERIANDPTIRDRSDDAIVPLMALGHSKSIPDANNLDRILKLLTRRFGDRLHFWTGQDAVEHWRDRLVVAPIRAAA